MIAEVLLPRRFFWFMHVGHFLRYSLAGEAPLFLRAFGRACFRLEELAGGHVQPPGRTATAAAT